MDSTENNNQETPAPVPKPRRSAVNINTDANLNNKTAYENVSIDLINKNINIKDENLQNNTKNNKLQTNKRFLMPNVATSPTAETVNTQILTKLNDLTNVPNKNQKNSSINLDEVNKLNSIYSDDVNETVRPVPAPRRSNAYKVQNTKKMNQLPSTSSECENSKKIDDKFSESSSKSNASHQKQTGSYSFVQDECDASSIDAAPAKYSVRRYSSSSSLDSSQSSLNAETKYQSTSPG